MSRVHSDQHGFAVVMAMFLALLVSAAGAAMTYVATSETASTMSYTTMSQSRYAAESGMAAATNYLLSAGYAGVGPGSGVDALANYDISVSPVVRTGGGGGVVRLSTGADSNYPNADVVTAFQAAAGGTLGVSNGTAQYGAHATLIAMRQITDAMSGQPRLLQTWEITGTGRMTGVGSAEVEVMAVIDRETRPVFNYAAFATSNGCAALSFSGNSQTHSYDSTAPLVSGRPVLINSDGHVGTNGNLQEIGSAVINGSLSTPRAGVGACTAHNVTAHTVAGNATVTGGLVQLPQPVDYPTPAVPSPLPGSSTDTISGASCPAGFATVCSVVSGVVTFTPPPGVPIVLDNLRITGGADVRLNAGTYIMNTLHISGNSRIIVDAASGGPALIQIAGQGSATTVIDVVGNGIANTTWDPTWLRFEYHGTKTIALSGNGDTAALFYAPLARAELSGNADFFGSLIMGQVNSTGNAGLHYDRRLQSCTNGCITAANPVMSTFSWRTF